MAVCVVEDHPLMAEGLVEHLRRAFDDVSEVYVGPSIDQALVAMSQEPADVVILDLDLGDDRPPRDNIARMVDSGVPVVVVSALAGNAVVREAIECGVHAYVSKSASPGEFEQAVGSARSGEQYMSVELAQALVGAHASDAGAAPRLSAQEVTALVLYASGMKLSAVARRMNISHSTANEYIKRVRIKYARTGNPVPTKVHLYQAAREAGWIA